ncbi:MAG: TldD/PmbA family protein [Gammaproteobacteria bacterium]|nr:TldD/PmbA family protein [Gammaproteobacteria bacterium]NIR83610.1 TldD/PmbA family protein [Gammaproteobacteria bacterium]NIR91583.1 TldD/PmbA family protein [Gammaproteobacteria bacterium]NIU04772.1 TldD/PmbA family protein [Gammaproteobacteria bacterium]NIV53122.1 TldD/PmbA family protein [Gammaproteobacteria bacterium]
MLDAIAESFGQIAPAADYWSLRVVDARTESITVRQDIPQPPGLHRSLGAMVTVLDAEGVGYAATSDLSRSGLVRAVRTAREWAKRTAPFSLLAPAHLPRSNHRGRYQSRVARPWRTAALPDKLTLVHEACRGLKIHERIVDWLAAVVHRQTEILLVTSEEGRIEQTFSYIHPYLAAFANEGSETQRRSLGMDAARQGGLEQLASLGFTPEQAHRVAEEALLLLDAPACPSTTTDVLLTPSQMILQIHESIGHPLELDRILGDERNYAGRSFVTPDMFGSYRYGSELLNVTFDPTRPEQLTSYGWDDEGTAAQRQTIIRDGVLERPLGGATSQARANLTGVASARACDWNRPPIDRMANLNLEPGERSFEELVASIERGVMMDANRSWSIDDSRNKFQFGCEYARLIEDGELKAVLKDPNYRGVSATFWRSLAGVGSPDELRVMGVGTCGKGEPNQGIHVGHAAPPCVFRDVAVFSGT